MGLYYYALGLEYVLVECMISVSSSSNSVQFLDCVLYGRLAMSRFDVVLPHLKVKALRVSCNWCLGP